MPQVPPESRKLTGHLLVQMQNNHVQLCGDTGVFCEIQCCASKQGEKQVKAGLYMDMSGLHVQLCFTTWCIDMDQQKSDNLLLPKQLVRWLL